MLTHSFPTRRSSDLLVDSNVALHDGMTVGAAYRGRVGSVVVAASAGWGMMRAPDNASGSDPTAYNAGLSLGLADWTVAAAFAGAEDDTVTGDGSGDRKSTRLNSSH